MEGKDKKFDRGRETAGRYHTPEFGKAFTSIGSVSSVQGYTFMILGIA